jgi:hemerythrin-like metal-binding protein
MDEQHGILMDSMNELRLALVRGSGRDQVTRLLETLIEFTRMHFQSEEQLMEKTGFPGLPEHRSEHQRLLRLFRESALGAHLGEEVRMRPLRDGYMAHIEGPDQQYGPWMNERGVD